MVFPESLQLIQAGEEKTHIGAEKAHDDVLTPTHGDPPGTFPNLGIDSPWESSSFLCIDVKTVQWEHYYRSQSSETHHAKTKAKQEDL